MRIIIGADHAGFELKEALVPFIEQLGYDVQDVGASEYDEDDDYPDYIAPVAEAISRQYQDGDHIDDSRRAMGIVIGGSGQGEAIVANRFPNVRAVVFNGQYDPRDGRETPNEIVTSRQHNDANILSLGARFLSVDEAREAVELWLETAFSGEERHARRIEKIESYPNHSHSHGGYSSDNS
jgi:ribose 5-phosphate isomerase B